MNWSRLSPLSISFLPLLSLAILLLVLALPMVVFGQGAQPNQQQTQGWIEWILWGIVSGVFGGLTYLAGLMLDWTILNLVLNFGSLFQSSGLGLAVNNLWAVVRDIFNLTFIFGLVFIGFQLILNNESSSARKAIGNLIIAALLVNFSLFITKTVIDFSNIATVQIAQVIYRNSGSVENPSISREFANQMGLSSVWQNGARATENPAPATGYLYIFGTMIVFCVAAFSFAAGAVMLFVRFIVLNFMMILSPIMFLGLVFSSFSGYSKDYWKKFLNQCFFAPAFLLMMYFSLYVLGQFTGMITRTNSIGTVFTTGNTNIAGLAGLFLGAGFLVASVMIAQKMSTTGVGVIDKFSTGAVGKIRGTISGAAMLPVRGATAGGRFAGNRVGGMGARAVGKTAGDLSNRLNNRLGKLAQGGSLSRATARTLERTVSAGLKSAQNASILGSETVEAREKRIKTQQAGFNTNVQEQARSAAVEAQLEIINNNNNINDPAHRANRTNAMNALAAQIKRMSNDEILGIDQEILQSPEFAQHLTDAHNTAIKNSGIYTNAEAKLISDARDNGTFDTISESLNSTNASAAELNTSLDQLTQTVQRLPLDRLQGLSIAKLTDERVAINLTEKQLDDLQNSGRFDATQMQSIRTARDNGFTAIASGTAPNISNVSNANHIPVIQNRLNRLLSGGSNSVGNLPVRMMLHPNVIPHLTPSIVEARMKNGMTPTDRQDLNQALATYWGGVAQKPNEWVVWERTSSGAEFFR